MNERRLGRSIGALLASILAVVVLSLGTDTVLHATGVFPPWGQPMSDGLYVLATLYRIKFGVFGGFIVARLAPNRPMQHALLSGVVGLILSTVGMVVTWDKGPDFGPRWYPLALAATAIPCAWAGGKLHSIQSRTRLA